MMEAEAEAKLRLEIGYLTRLIEAHKAIKCRQSTVTTSTTHTTMTSTRGTLKRVRLGSAVPSWSHSGSISCHLPSCKPSSLPCKSSSPQTQKPQQLTSSQNTHSTCKPSDIQEVSTPNDESGSLVEGMDLSILPGGEEECKLATGSKRNVSSRDKGMIFINGNSKRKKLNNSQKGINSDYSWKPNAVGPISSTAISNPIIFKRSLLKKNVKNKIHSKHIGMPDRSKLKWTNDTIRELNVTLQDKQTMSTYSFRPIPAASIVSRKRGRRNTESSPFIIRKYKMMRCPSTSDSSRTFSERRRQYLFNQSVHSHSPRVKRRKIANCGTPVRQTTKHKVWKPDIDADRDTSNKILLNGFELKTKQGNKQWLSEAAALKNTKRKQRKSLSKKKANVVNVMGAQYAMATSGKSLKKILTSPIISKVTPPRRRKLSSSSTIHSVSAKRQRTSSVIKRSLNRVWSNKQLSPNTQYCIFFNRFGHCNRGDKCTYVHDPKRVAICNKFLRGACDKTNGECPFSHNITKEKMPVCSFFLWGLCTRTDCPYLHVSVGKDADICQDFVGGYCSLGDKCIKQHVLECPEFTKDGVCPRENKCPLKHKKKRRRTKSNVFSNDVSHTTETAGSSDKTVPSIKEPYPFRKARYRLERNINSKHTPEIASPTQLITPAQLEFIPLETTDVPEFIAL